MTHDALSSMCVWWVCVCEGWGGAGVVGGPHIDIGEGGNKVANI